MFSPLASVVLRHWMVRLLVTVFLGLGLTGCAPMLGLGAFDWTPPGDPVPQEARQVADELGSEITLSPQPPGTYYLVEHGSGMFVGKIIVPRGATEPVKPLAKLRELKPTRRYFVYFLAKE